MKAITGLSIGVAGLILGGVFSGSSASPVLRPFDAPHDDFDVIDELDAIELPGLGRATREYAVAFIDGVEGDVTLPGFEGAIALDGGGVLRRVHANLEESDSYGEQFMLSVKKGRASPLLLEMADQRACMPEVRICLIRRTGSAPAVQYFSITLSKFRLVNFWNQTQAVGSGGTPDTELTSIHTDRFMLVKLGNAWCGDTQYPPPSTITYRDERSGTERTIVVPN